MGLSNLMDTVQNRQPVLSSCQAHAHPAAQTQRAAVQCQAATAWYVAVRMWPPTGCTHCTTMRGGRLCIHSVG